MTCTLYPVVNQTKFSTFSFLLRHHLVIFHLIKHGQCVLKDAARVELLCLTNVLTGSFHGARYLTNGVFIDLEATVGTYELRSYGGEQ